MINPMYIQYTKNREGGGRMSIYRNREGWISLNHNVKFKFLSTTCASVAVSFIELQTSYFNRTGCNQILQCEGGGDATG